MSESNVVPKRALSGSPPLRPTSPPAKKAKVELETPASGPSLPTFFPPVDSATLPTTSEAIPEVAAPVVSVGASTKPAQNKKSDNKAQKGRKGKGKGKAKPHKPGGAEETGQFDVLELLGVERVKEMDREAEDADRDWRSEAEAEWGKGFDGKDVEVRVVGMSAHGDGLAILSCGSPSLPVRILTIPFTLPNELALVHVHRHEPDFYMSHADLVRIIEPSPDRQGPTVQMEGAPTTTEISPELAAVKAKYGERVQCKYFGVCSGCQYQPLSYEQQLTLKQSVVRKAFANFSLLDPSLIPAIGPTLPSPLQYGYRTKLTPHFQAPPASGKSGGGRSQRGKGKAQQQAEATGEEKEWEVTIGFEEKGRKRVIDIEECVIATKVINDAMVSERATVKANISKYKRGATLLLRDSLPPRPEGTTRPAPGTPFPVEEHVIITDHHATVREQVGTVEFEQMAGSFFQNNNSILPSLLEYIASAVSVPKSGNAVKSEEEKRYLIDAYCGSGLFAISLADQFDRIEGVEIDKASVKWAKLNADYNKGAGRGEVGFRAGNAEAIFGTIDFPPKQTTILIDPPRKGCDALFLSQLLAFNPSTIVYVSCNVHTQARDIGWLITESAKKAAEAGDGKKGFWIESVRAADLFANTHHAEGVAILRRDV
ncbi:hypothetical protein P7C70_g4374, partial [Phenoliferia sp. Uapishka_3]